MASKKIRRAPHPLQWVFEPLESEETFLQKKMFGCEAAYLRGRLVLVLADGKEPWNGLLICTSRDHHAELIREFSALAPHLVLGKWLYLSQRHREFEEVAQNVVQCVLKDDSRIGVEPRGKKRVVLKEK